MADFSFVSIIKIIWDAIKALLGFSQKKKLIKKVKTIVVSSERKITGVNSVHGVDVEVIRFRIYENMLEALEEFANGMPDTLMVEEILELRRFIRESRNIPIPTGMFPEGMNFYNARFRELRRMKWMR